MKNVEKIAQFITRTKGNNVIIHKVPETRNWLVCSKNEERKWNTILCDPLEETWVEIEPLTDKQHINLWETFKKIEIENKVIFIEESSLKKQTKKLL